MAEEFNGPVVINGELKIPGPVRPEPAAQFGSHVGVDGNLDLAGSLHVFSGASIKVDGPVRPEPAAQFGSHVGVDGNLDVAGDIHLLNADCAEDFDLAEGAETDPGTVMVLDDDGRLQHSTGCYDSRVAGIVAGAGSFRPAIVLDRHGRGARTTISLVGKAFCKADAGAHPIRVGDLLTTSATPGHAMAATDPARAFGSVIGKALRPLRNGVGLIPVLIALQ